MISPRAILLFLLSLAAWCPGALFGQAQTEWEIRALSDNGWVEFDTETRIATATNGVLVKYGAAVLTADSVAVDQASGEVQADGQVRIQQGDLIWVSDHINYNFKTHQMLSEQFRTGKSPVFASGEALHGDVTNKVYYATNAVVSAEDVTKPLVKIRAKYIKIVPGQRIEAHGATFYVGGVPVFYLPWYSRDLNSAPKLTVLPGYRSYYGPFLLGSYRWALNDDIDGLLHLDYRLKRGVGAGPDVNYDFDRWGKGTASYYYTYDQDPEAGHAPMPLPHNRQRVDFSYFANPVTNLEARSVVRFESDPYVLHDFFPREYRNDPQPSSYFEVNKLWDNFSLDAYAQPQVNEFLETVERLPDIRLTGYRQQIGATPIYYESVSSAGYYRRRFAENAGPYGAPSGDNYEAARADTYHQLLVPYTLFGWLNITPRVGGRLTYYSSATGPGAITDEEYRGVFNTGAEVSFKASQLWPGVRNDFLQLDGVRHIIEPTANYVYVPNPTVRPPDLPRFDYELPSLRLLPINYPDYNAIDSIDSQNVVRLGLRNKIQTKRNDRVVNALSWDVYTDWRVRPREDQSTYSDLYSDLVLRPRDWLTLESLLRYDMHQNEWVLALHTLTIQPNETWSWGLGHWYIRDEPPEPAGLGIGNNLFTSTFFYRFDPNWAFRASHHFEAKDGRMQEQAYTLYRDLRSWTSALVFIVRENTTGPTDFTFAFTFSLKAFPRYPLGSDTLRPYSLLEGR